METDRIADKIRKLLALSKSSNQYEAELAMERASDLMEKYQVTMADVLVQDIGQGIDPVVSEVWTVPGLDMKLHYVTTLAWACANLYDGTVLSHTKLACTRLTWVGRRDSIDSAKATFEYLWSSWKGIVVTDLTREKERHVGPKGSWTPAMTMKYKHGHGVGYSSSIWWRVDSMVKDKEKRMEDLGGSCKDLIVINKNGIEKWMGEHHIRTSYTKQSNGSTKGYMAGLVAGERADLGQTKIGLRR
jgi:hypothetical protein